MAKAKRTAKQIAASTKNIKAYETKDDNMNFFWGLAFGLALGLTLVWLFFA